MNPAYSLWLNTGTLAEQLKTACLLECTARKPGNVSPQRSFSDVSYADFVMSADVVAPILAQSATLGVGRAIHAAVRATQAAVGTNTNLGMLLLLAPLAAVPCGTPCRSGIQPVLDQLDLEQTFWIYEAIRLAQPGGLGQVARHDVAQAPEVPIVTAMAAAPHDRIAWQYTHCFEDVLNRGREWYLQFLQSDPDWETALIRVQLKFLAAQSDSLILRKCGEVIAEEVRTRARAVLQAWPSGSAMPDKVLQFDEWLRADGHRRNPGTTADLLAAMLFAAIRDQVWTPPPTMTLS